MIGYLSEQGHPNVLLLTVFLRASRFKGTARIVRKIDLGRCLTLTKPIQWLLATTIRVIISILGQVLGLVQTSNYLSAYYIYVPN